MISAWAYYVTYDTCTFCEEHCRLAAKKRGFLQACVTSRNTVMSVIVPSTPKQVLVSMDMNSGALVRPVESQEVDPKSKWPPSQCTLKREKTTLWIQSDRCNEWFHQWHVKISKRKVEKEEFFCVEWFCRIFLFLKTLLYILTANVNKRCSSIMFCNM